MPTSENSSPDSPTIWVLGTVPPPVTGQTVLTEKVAKELQRAGRVKFISLSPGMSRVGLRFRLRRNALVAKSLATLLAHGRTSGTPLYLASNSRAGLFITAIVVSTARKLGYHVYLHHHSYAYIDSYDWRMAWIDRTMGKHGTHVVHCDQMESDFRARYTTRCSFESIYPSVVSIEASQPKSSPNTPFCLGHLSNLTHEKGIDLVLETFEKLHESGLNVCLKLAGPFHSRAAKEIVERSVRRHDGLVQHVGPVHGEAKQHFLKELDAFLFPTRYKNESWGIVLDEAMAAGVPVISLRRGCTPTVVGDRAGVIVDREADFVAAAQEQIKRWIDDPAAFGSATQAAVDQATYLRHEGERMLREFAAHVFSRQQKAPTLQQTN